MKIKKCSQERDRFQSKEVKGTIWEKAEDLRDFDYDQGGQIVNFTNWNNFENEGEFCCHEITGINWDCPKKTRMYLPPTYDWLIVTPLLQPQNTGCHHAFSWPLALDLELLPPSPVLPQWLLHCLLCASLATIRVWGGVSDWLSLEHNPTLAAKENGKVSGLFSLLPRYILKQKEDSASCHDSWDGGFLKHRCFQTRQSKKIANVLLSHQFLLLGWGLEKHPLGLFI